MDKEAPSKDKQSTFQVQPDSAGYDKYLGKSSASNQPLKSSQNIVPSRMRNPNHQAMNKQEVLKEKYSWKNNFKQQNYEYEQAVREFLKNKNDIEGEQAVSFLRSYFEEYGLKYNEEKRENFWELGYLVCQVLRLPSVTMAKKHRMANKLGKYDLCRKYPKDAKYCKCCGLIIQEELLDLKTLPANIKNVGSSTALYFATVKSITIILCVFFLVFGLSSIITNMISSKLYNSEINDPAFQLNILQSISLEAKQSSGVANVNWSLVLQCWNGVLTVVVLAFYFCARSCSQTFTELHVDLQTKKISDFSLLFENLLIVPDDQINDRLQSLQLQKIIDPNIKIVKISYAIPYNVDENALPSKKLCDEIYGKYKEQQEKLLKWMRIRGEKSQFPADLDLPTRQAVYSKLRQMRNQQHEVHQKYRQEFHQQIQNQKRVISYADAFVTFDSQRSKQQVLHRLRSSLKKIKLETAFEPQDIKWENFGQGKCQKYARKLLTFSVTVVILAISCFCLYNLENFKYYISQNNKQNKDEAILSIVVSVLLSTPIIFTNFVLKSTLMFNSEILLFLTEKERNTYHTHEQTSIGFKTVFATLANSIIVPLSIHYARDRNFYGENGLAENVFYFAITNSLVGVGMKIVNFDLIFNWLSAKWASLRCNKMKMLQSDLNKVYEDPQFQIGLEYSSFIFIYLYTCFFASMQPVIIVFGILGLAFLYWANKIVVFYYCRRPTPCHNELNQMMYQLILAGPLFYSLGSFLFTDYFSEKSGANRVASIMSIVLSILILTNLCSAFRMIFYSIGATQSMRVTSQYDKSKIQFASEYDRVNPLTSKKAITKFLEQKKKYAEASEKSSVLLDQNIAEEEQRN